LSHVASLDLIQAEIRLVEDRMLAQSNRHHPELQAALKHLIASGGKRIRPAVTLLVGEMLQGDLERLVTLAAAIEMLHTATLVHDDLIDGALLRRGIPTINSHWSPGATVLTGDFIFASAAKLAAETDSVRVMRLFADTLAIIVSGEITQMFSSHGVAVRDNYEQRIYAKTASMFELATAAAAMLSPVDDDAIHTIRQFGYEIGMAFQIVDDILDFTGEQTRVGKPVASDLRQGLITLPAIIYHELHPEDADLAAVMNGAVNERLIERLVHSIRASGAIEQSLAEARLFVERGVTYLLEMPPNRGRQSLEELAYYIVDREL
jgi:geranylgeranyl pyrophosphate synthase